MGRRHFPLNSRIMLASIAIALLTASSFTPPADMAAVSSARTMVSMNAANNANVKFNKKTGNKGLYGWQVKKNPKTGDTLNLRGYTVGSRAPPMAVNSGTTIAQTGFQYKGVVARTKYTVPGVGGDGGLDLRSFGSSEKELFVHRTNMLAQADKDCFYTRGKLGPIAATNPIFVHEGEMLSGKKDNFYS